jgi:hypothetical protein
MAIVWLSDLVKTNHKILQLRKKQVSSLTSTSNKSSEQIEVSFQSKLANSSNNRFGKP